MDSAIVEKLGCVTELILPIRVMVANGNEMICNRTCKDFEWWLQLQLFKVDVFLILLKNYHMVLGVQWLAPLDDILWNFRELTMISFKRPSFVNCMVMNQLLAFEQP